MELNCSFQLPGDLGAVDGIMGSVMEGLSEDGDLTY